jgi:hypothetical protein
MPKKPAAVIMRVQVFHPHRRAAARLAAESLERRARRRGLNTLTPAHVDAQISAQRRKPDPVTAGGVK